MWRYFDRVYATFVSHHREGTASRHPTLRLLERKLTRLERDLHLSDAQRVVWGEFATRSCDGIEALIGAAEPSERAAGSATQMFSHSENTVEAALIVIRRIRPSFDALYAVLDEEQRLRIERFVAGSWFGPASPHRRQRASWVPVWARYRNSRSFVSAR